MGALGALGPLWGNKTTKWDGGDTNDCPWEFAFAFGGGRPLDEQE
jgi:hypothetical protein